ncbi:MAG: hypothetical protein R3F43_31520 [bacterium]
MSLAADFGVTLTQHVLTRQHLHPEARGQFSGLLTQIGVAGKLIAAQVRRAGLIEVWGKTGETNVQGETVKKLDRIANDTLKEVLRRSGCVAVMASEEEEGAVVDGSASSRASTWSPSTRWMAPATSRRASASAPSSPSTASCPTSHARPGHTATRPRSGGREAHHLWVVDGAECTDGNGGRCFTLDPGSGEFFLTRAAMAYRPATRILSLNECSERTGPPGWRRTSAPSRPATTRTPGGSPIATSGRWWRTFTVTS